MRFTVAMIVGAFVLIGVFTLFGIDLVSTIGMGKTLFVVFLGMVYGVATFVAMEADRDAKLGKNQAQNNEENPT